MTLNATALIFATAARLLRPPDAVPIENWAEQHVRLGALTSDPGKWSADRTPYVRDILRCMSPDHPARKVTWVSGTQLGKTTAELVIAAYYLCQVPSSVMITLPGKQLAEEWSTKRLNDLFESSPSLRGRLSDAHDRRGAGENTKFSKIVPGGGAAKITWSSSGQLLRSTPARIVLNDEVEEFDLDVNDQGNALRLIERRQTNYTLAKLFNASSPANLEGSVIWPEFLKGDQRYYFLACPHCRHHQILVAKNFTWEPGQFKTAAFRCISCRERITERHKPSMLAGGIWVATADHPDLLQTGFSDADLNLLESVFSSMAMERFVSYHMSAYYSPAGWYSWEEAARGWEESEGIPTDRKVYVNTTQAEPYQTKGDAPDDQILEAQAESYERGIVPAGAAVVFAGVDVQWDRLELELAAYGPNRERWSIDYLTLQGDTLQPEVWQALHEVLMRDLPTEEGGTLPIQAMAIDSGSRPERVYEFARAHTQIPYNPAEWRVITPRTVIVTKGELSFARIIAGVSNDAAATRRGVRIFRVGTGTAKLELIAGLKLKRARPGEAIPTGLCHFPRYDAAYFQGLCSESLVFNSRGKPEFYKDPVRRNEPFDCAVLVRAAAALTHVEVWSNEAWKKKLAACRPVTVAAATPKPAHSAAFAPIVPDDPYL